MVTISIETNSGRNLAVAFWLSSVQFAHKPKQAAVVPAYKRACGCDSLLPAVPTKTLVRKGHTFSRSAKVANSRTATSVMVAES